MVNVSPAFKGTYSIPYSVLAEMQEKSPEKLQQLGEETAKAVLPDGKICQSNEGINITVPFEKEQEYASILAKYNISTQKA